MIQFAPKKWIPIDKQYHFVFGFFFSAFGLGIGYAITDSKIVISLIMILLSLILGLAKEIYDDYVTTSKVFDWWDVLATTLGGVFLVVLFLIFGQ